MNERMDASLAINALQAAIMHRKREGMNTHGCIVHSDRGSQFRSNAYTQALRNHHLIGSMGRVGACGDNACC